MAIAVEAPVVNVVGLHAPDAGTHYPVGAQQVCEETFAPLSVEYDEDLVRSTVTRQRIEAGPHSVWRYADLLPVLSTDPDHRVDLGTGWTPLRRAPRLGAALGLEDLWIKDDTRNPSGSFKDRVVTMAVSAARALGIDTVACASTGNLANSVAAHAAACGMRAYVFIPHDLEHGKVVGSAVHGARVVSVDGTYDDVNRLCQEVADEHGWGFVNINLRPYYSEGSKTLGFEIAEQLGWRLPDHVVAPCASGSMYTKIHKGFRELVRHGLVADHPVRMSGAQALGCSPIATAFAEGTTQVRPVRPDTIARSLAIGNPADGYLAVALAQETDGAIGAVDDDEVVAGIQLLARTEGVFGETAAGVTVANLRRFAASGHVRRDERVVAVLSGNGYKTIDAVADHVGPTHRVGPSFAAFEAALRESAPDRDGSPTSP